MASFRCFQRLLKATRWWSEIICSGCPICLLLHLLVWVTGYLDSELWETLQNSTIMMHYASHKLPICPAAGSFWGWHLRVVARMTTAQISDLAECLRWWNICPNLAIYTSWPNSQLVRGNPMQLACHIFHFAMSHQRKGKLKNYFNGASYRWNRN